MTKILLSVILFLFHVNAFAQIEISGLVDVEVSSGGADSDFGVNEIAMRIPSIILSTIAIFLTFYIGKFLFSERTGLLAAFFHSTNGFLIEITKQQRNRIFYFRKYVNLFSAESEEVGLD